MNCPYLNGDGCPTPHMCDLIGQCWDKLRESRGYYNKPEPRGYKQLPKGYAEIDSYDEWAQDDHAGSPAPSEPVCWCDEQGFEPKDVSCGDCPTKDYKRVPAPSAQSSKAALSDERDAFEAWAKRKYGPNAALFTNTDRTNVAWEVWQAARAQAPDERTLWQPIETAPRDGREVILRRGSRVGAAQWVRWSDEDEKYEGWTVGLDGDLWGDDKAPTHWMPLPPAPETGITPQAGKESGDAS